MAADNNMMGKVVLVGAGCGDPELITVKAVRCLQEADVVLTDRLVSRDILNDYVRREATVIYVGKQCRRGFSTPQQSINELIIQFAKDGKLVVRLKGGDVSVFSNVLDELETLVENEIPYEIVPGVSAALGAAAYTGIPLTARGYSNAVRLLTFYKNDVISDEYWKELAATADTLVFYMSSETLDSVVENLVKHGIGADKLLAVIEQATTPAQRVYTCALHDYGNCLKGKVFASPTLIMIGKVVALQQKFGWMENATSGEEYFKPIEDLQYEQLVNGSIKHTQ